MSYQFRAVEEYWTNFYYLPDEQKELVREKWQIFKLNPFDSRLGTHKIWRLSQIAKHTIYSVIIEQDGDLRVIFRIDGSVVTTLNVGGHDLYK